MDDRARRMSESMVGEETERTELPVPLQKRIFKQYCGAALFGVITILCVAIFDNFGYMVGFLFSAFLAWIGRDIASRWYKGKIICKRVVCQKVRRSMLTKSKVQVILKECASNEGNIYNFSLPASGREAAMIFEGCIMDIYIDSTNIAELIAWQLIDVVE